MHSRGKPAAVFNLKERVLGSKKSSAEPTVIVKPETGEVFDTPKDIKAASLNYCVKLLTNRPPKEEYEEIYKYKKELHEQRMKETISNDLDEMPLDLFNKALEKIKHKSGDKYKFMVRGGDSLLNTIFHLFFVIWKE